MTTTTINTCIPTILHSSARQRFGEFETRRVVALERLSQLCNGWQQHHIRDAMHRGHANAASECQDCGGTPHQSDRPLATLTEGDPLLFCGAVTETPCFAASRVNPPSLEGGMPQSVNEVPPGTNSASAFSGKTRSKQTRHIVWGMDTANSHLGTVAHTRGSVLAH